MSGDVDRRTAVSVAVALVALIAIVVVAIALASDGGGDEPATGSAPSQAPSQGAAPPSAGGLPPGIAECIADQGYELESPDQLHTVPEQVLETCFNALHEGGGAP
jgi:hypothetical protein